MMTSVISSREPELPDNPLLLQLATEVRHTLHHVLGSIELASEESLTRQQTKHLGRCRDSAYDLLRVVNDVSELADSGSFAQTTANFEMPAMLEEFSSLIGLRATRKQLDLRWSVDRTMPRFVLASRPAIENVLYRLVDNSIKFTEHGGINLSVKVDSTGQPLGEVTIEIADTGPGIPLEVLDDLRRPVLEAQGKGLGFRVVRKRLAEIGGRLDILASGPEGTTLAIVFPVGIPSIGPGGEQVSRDPSHNAKLKLLVAEDSDDSFAVFETFVKDEGHLISRAVNGAEAVEMFKADDFDMVVMDINMPIMDGYTATRTIREWETQQGRARLPILLLSAEDAGRQVRIGSSVGCSGYLTKPTPKRELLSALRHYSGVMLGHAEEVRR